MKQKIVRLAIFYRKIGQKVAVYILEKLKIAIFIYQSYTKFMNFIVIPDLYFFCGYFYIKAMKV